MANPASNNPNNGFLSIKNIPQNLTTTLGYSRKLEANEKERQDTAELMSDLNYLTKNFLKNKSGFADQEGRSKLVSSSKGTQKLFEASELVNSFKT